MKAKESTRLIFDMEKIKYTVIIINPKNISDLTIGNYIVEQLRKLKYLGVRTDIQYNMHGKITLIGFSNLHQYKKEPKNNFILVM